jgi:hypothetical protein
MKNRSGFGYGANSGLHGCLFAVLEMSRNGFAQLGLVATPQNAHDHFLASHAAARDRLGAASLGHILGFTADEGFIRLKFATALNERAGLHGEPDAM